VIGFTKGKDFPQTANVKVLAGNVWHNINLAPTQAQKDRFLEAPHQGQPGNEVSRPLEVNQVAGAESFSQVPAQ